MVENPEDGKTKQTEWGHKQNTFFFFCYEGTTWTSKSITAVLLNDKMGFILYFLHFRVGIISQNQTA